MGFQSFLQEIRVTFQDKISNKLIRDCYDKIDGTDDLIDRAIVLESYRHLIDKEIQTLSIDEREKFVNIATIFNYDDETDPPSPEYLNLKLKNVNIFGNGNQVDYLVGTLLKLYVSRIACYHAPIWSKYCSDEEYSCSDDEYSCSDDE